MPSFKEEIRASVAALGLDGPREQEIVEELGQHMSDRYDELVAGGAREDDAWRAVTQELSSGRLLAELRPLEKKSPARGRAPGEDDGSGGALRGLLRDFRYGARQLRLNPGFATVAILSLALGTGANTAIFQLLDAIRMRALPVHAPPELAEVKVVNDTAGRTGSFNGRHPNLTTTLWEQLRERQQGFSSIAAWSTESLDRSLGGESRPTQALWVSGTFFETLGVKAVLGRLLSRADDVSGCGSPGVVVSDGFWKRELGASASVLGRSIPLEGRSFEVVGVAPPSFFGVEVGRTFDVALPICADPLIHRERPRNTDPQVWWLGAIGRLAPGWTAGRATAHLATISRSLFQATLPTAYDAVDGKSYLKFQLAAFPAASGVSRLRKQYESPLLFLMAIAALVLLIACANLANLMLARASARRREMAVRMALGASRARLIRQLLAESLLLAFLGAFSGALLAQALSRLLVAFLSTEGTPLFVDLAPDFRVLGFTALLAVVTCVLFGLTPAIQASRTAPGEALKASARGIVGGGGRFGIRRVLVVTQVAFSLVLLVGALLFVRTLRNLTTLDAGFRRDRILVAQIDLTPLKLPAERRTPWKSELLTRLRAIPGVTSAADVDIMPVSGDGWNESVRIGGGAGDRKIANFDRVSPGYFETMGTPLLAGRDFTEHDTTGSPAVALVTETFAKKLMGGENPIGKTFGVIQQGGKPDRILQIVGLVKDAKFYNLREEFTPIVFVPEAQDTDPGPYMQVAIRAERPTELISAVKRTVAEASPAALILFRVFDTMIKEALLRERLMASLSGFFGLLAGILAMIGLYGVISFMVARRRNEIGVRMALGASRSDILALVMREAAALLGTGIAIGTVLALLAATTARTLLFGLGPSDPLTVVAAAASLAAVAAAASLLPARRAATLDPVRALREE